MEQRAVRVRALLLVGSVALSGLSKLSEFQFSHLSAGMRTADCVSSN